MLFKFLCTLCALVSSSSPLDHPAITNGLMANDVVQITVDVGGTVIRDLCSDFAPNITNATCSNTLFEASRKEAFIIIANQTMVLKPIGNELNCYGELFQCYSITYQLTISALKAYNDSLIMQKKFAITVRDASIFTIQLITLTCGLIIGGSICVIGICCCEQKHLCIRRKAEQSFPSITAESIQPLKALVESAAKP